MLHMNYSIFRSRTFWMILGMAALGAGNALVPVIPADFQALAMAILATAATVFHLDTAKTSGATN